jgi:hypothetical protein
MRALAVRRRHGMHDDGLTSLVEAMKVRHRRIEREETVEGERGGLALARERLLATQLDPIRIADRRDRREPVEGAAQHDDEKARIPALGTGDARHMRPSEQHA